MEPGPLGPEERPHAADAPEPVWHQGFPSEAQVEEGGRHPSPCQFTITTPKAEPAPVTTSLGLGVKPGQSVTGRDTRMG